ncbi:MAG: N-acetylmuramoyl-L-alanine amidase [Bacteroidales bacterium]|nr:N-acetylmuramoyl-L-alanine amidase [Bacteroidales bacterium]
MVSFGQGKGTIKTVVIDAGHGGKDPGTVGRRTQEKYVALSVALKVGTLIQRNFRDVEVIYTRDRDRFIELHERAAIANRNKADLFISIHANANNLKTLRGAETYIMGLHRSQANLEIAKLENAAILLETDYSSKYEGFDPNSDESYITFSLYQNSNLESSSRFAAEIQEQMKERVGLNDRGVRQAGFLVLYKTTMPSVLVEVGYLSNVDEENFLISEKGQDYIASAIFRAFKSYKNEVEQQSGGPVAIRKDAPGPSGQPNRNGIIFKIQIAASPDEINLTSPRFRGVKGIQMYQHNGMFKYTYGEETDLEKAKALHARMQSTGFTDAFIVAFYKGERISLDQAKSLLGR